MPLVAHNNLPTFGRLKQEGQVILPADRAIHQDIRELHIGLLNMMPDTALAATERQFYRLVGESNPIAQFYMHPFTLPEIRRSAKAQRHIDSYYEPFEKIRAEGLDALIVTGANVTHPELSDEPFWKPLEDVFGWAMENVTSTLCSCLATHAVLDLHHGQKRRPGGRGIAIIHWCWTSIPASMFPTRASTRSAAGSSMRRDFMCWWKAKWPEFTSRSARTVSAWFISRGIPNTTP